MTGMHTNVAIIGAGPAGLLLGQLLAQSGISSVILEARSRSYIENRVRAGVLEEQTASVIASVGAGARMAREGLRHRGIELVFGGQAHRIDFGALTGKAMTIYGQQEVIKDLVAVRLAAELPLYFAVENVSLAALDTDTPQVSFTHEGVAQTLQCDFIAGCDGFHGVSRSSIPAGVLRIYERVYPYAWLGILAAAAPIGEIIYARHENGFALHSLRSPDLTRLYLQCGPDEPLEPWTDARIWSELQQRLTVTGGPRLNEGPILQKSMTPMRSFVVEPMQYRRLFLAGDAAHIVPPTGAKGMNMAAADVQVLSSAFVQFYDKGLSAGLRDYSAVCLDRVWKVQRFSRMMTDLLHVNPADTPFDTRCREAELAYLATAAAGSATFAENYVGLPVRLS
jgi:p-hydroxybenzoate 3-monooxygenase